MKRFSKKSQFTDLSAVRGRPLRILHISWTTGRNGRLRLSHSYEIDSDGSVSPLELEPQLLGDLFAFWKSQNPTSDQVVEFLRQHGVEVDAVLGTHDDTGQGGPVLRAWQQIRRRLDDNERALLDIMR